MKEDPYFFISRFYDAFAIPVLSPFRRLTAEIVLRKFAALPTIQVLEVACGTGTQSELLARQGLHVAALDKSRGMIGQARKRARGDGSPGFDLVQGDASALPFASSTFHAVVIQLALHEMSNEVRDASMHEVKRVAKRNALFMILDFLPTKGVRLTTPFLWLAELGAGTTHFKNAREFVKRGGLPALMERHGLDQNSSHPFFEGHIGLAVARRKR